MTAYLAYDTETTGLPLWNEPSEHIGQPHIVEIAALLVDDGSGEVINQFRAVVRPDGWTIPDEVARIHGITTERAMDEGIREIDALNGALEFWRHAGFRVAHNESFDARIVRIALKRFRPDLADRWKYGAAQCTAKLASPILRLPPTDRMRSAGFSKYKTPNLTECVRAFLGREHVGAHGAMADADACREVFEAIRSGALQYPDKPAPTPTGRPAKTPAASPAGGWNF